MEFPLPGISHSLISTLHPVLAHKGHSQGYHECLRSKIMHQWTTQYEWIKQNKKTTEYYSYYSDDLLNIFFSVPNGQEHDFPNSPHTNLSLSGSLCHFGRCGWTGPGNDRKCQREPTIIYIYIYIHIVINIYIYYYIILYYLVLY